MVHEVLSNQRQQQGAMAEHLNGLNGINRQQLRGMQAEQRAELERLANAQQEAANKAAMAEQALAGLRDVTLEHRNAFGQMAAAQGVVHQNIDNSHTSTTVVHNNVDMEVHNRAMVLLQSHATQFGEYTRQNQMSAEQMQRLLYTHLMREQHPAVIHIMPPPGEQSIVQYTGGGPPPPPPGAGAIKVKKQTKKKKEPRPINVTNAPPPPPPPPAPEPIPVPTIPTTVPTYDIGTPPPPVARGRPRSRTPRAASRQPPTTPWSGGAEDPPAMPAAGRGRPPKRASDVESTEAPVAVRPRAKSRARSVSIAETVFYPEEKELTPRRRGRPRKPPILPPHEAAA